VRFGVHYLNTYLPELDGPVPELYQHLSQQIQEAEALGFDDAWVTEHHFHEFGGLIPDPPVFLTALAGATSRIHLGVAISVLPLRNPLQNAESYAMVDVISNGRLEFGVARGASPEEFAEFRIDYADSGQRLREHAEVMLQAWSDEPVNFHGELYEYENVRVLPKPLQRPHPPIWVGASRSDGTFQWAGEKGFHLMTLPYPQEPAVLLHWIGVYQDALRQHGYDPASREILGKFHVYVGESDAAARRAAEPYWLNYYRISAERGSWTMPKAPTPAEYAKQIAQNGVIVGDPARCIEVIQYWRETLGLTTLSGTFHFGGMPHELALRSLRLFAERVMPAFSGSLALPARER
jgi:natural product biosynthesis luciferase-like monooxygenase protein